MTINSSSAMASNVWDTNFWGPVTATLDWCEANYQFSRYVAEAANTVSNLLTVIFALYGAQQTHAAHLPLRYLTGYVGFALVGLGSMIFHATLLYEAQLADELPMVYVASYCCAVLFDTERGFSLRTPKTTFLITIFFTFNVLFTWCYAVYRNPIFHQVTFAILMLTNTFRTAHLLRYSELRERIPDDVKATLSDIISSGAALFILGFVVWNLDNIFCSKITEWKVAMGWPVAFLLEGHSWWHIFTAIGTYLMLIGNTYLTLCIKDDPAKYRTDWAFGFPTLRRNPKTKAS